MSITRGGRAAGLIAAAVALAVAVSLFAASSAAASTGDWGHIHPSESVPTGTNTFAAADIHCASGTCTYDPTMTFTVTASNGTVLQNVGSSTPFIDYSNGNAVIGSCSVTTATLAVCHFTGSGTESAGSNEGFQLSFTVPNTIANGAVALTFNWGDTTVTGNTNTNNDTFTVYAANTVGSPLVSPALLAGLGGGAGVALVIGGFLLLNRRRRAGDVPAAVVPLG